MKHNPETFYKEQTALHQSIVQALNKHMRLLSILRLMVFLATAYGIYLTFSNWKIAGVLAVIGLSVFLMLLMRYSKIKHKRNLEQAIVAFNDEEIKIKNDGVYHRFDGVAFQDPEHAYCMDIDLFGKGSFFQHINRTFVKEGTETLADLLKANDKNHIEARQKAISELANKPEWRQQYSAIASIIQVETPAKQINSWLLNYKPDLATFLKALPLGFGTVSLLIIILVFLGVASPNILGLWLGLGLLLTGRYLKTVNVIASQTDKLKETFQQYAALLEEIEKETFQSSLLQEQQRKITQQGKPASVIFSELSRLMDRLDNRNNFISAIFGNGFFLLDIKNTYAIEQWIKAYSNKTTEWFEVIAFFDAYNSLGNYVFNHPEYVFSEIQEGKGGIQAEKLGHPLLKSSKRVDNDLSINNEEFFIVTGANMAGKSTFLRTVSLHIVMANMGLPVCAKSSKYHPVKLITSMRTSDSLTDESSYFFSELTRLKYIVDAIQDENYFIVLDEILKGTNSTDKAIGSRKFVEKLVTSKATGIIATHDLSLCEITKELKAVKNYYFDAEIINDELAFDYTFKQGICKNMNASFLLKKMDII